MACDDPVIGLKISLQFRWSSLGYVFEEGYATWLAKTLHAQGLSVINDIDHVDWDHIPIDQFGLGMVDIQVLKMTKLCDDEIAQK